MNARLDICGSHFFKTDFSQTCLFPIGFICRICSVGLISKYGHVHHGHDNKCCFKTYKLYNVCLLHVNNKHDG